MKENLIYAAHQTNFLPYVGFWLKMDEADSFGLMSHNQFSKGNLANRVLIGDDNKNSWLTIPVSVSMGDKISEARIARNFKPNKIKNTLYHTYSKTKYWPNYSGEIIDCFDSIGEGSSLVDLNTSLIKIIKKFLEIETTIKIVNPDKNMSASENLAMWASDSQATMYLSGAGGKNYLNEAPFLDLDISVDYFSHNITGQFSTVSIVSCLMNMGKDWRKVTQK